MCIELLLTETHAPRARFRSFLLTNRSNKSHTHIFSLLHLGSRLQLLALGYLQYTHPSLPSLYPPPSTGPNERHRSSATHSPPGKPTRRFNASLVFHSASVTHGLRLSTYPQSTWQASRTR
ncbi:uncharacterized protein EI97DRAFT_50021 [Westerdykella ornata]|uniref:Uncharacterized protein n=1 Tax=Westerdykella ornata TaxID=318751 RepID=A0A6A6JIA2_WESOR|nr:uncharacterized protein EI97DRAFT_50021 [Westerdykella ornata]KAF2276127.1 hypothetical protein EI97DRAFT_50021 [Westerdykella ornata]